MTISELNDLCKRNNIKENVTILSDSRWECSESPVELVWYSEIDNVIVLTQNHQYEPYTIDDSSWHILTKGQTLKLLK